MNESAVFTRLAHMRRRYLCLLSRRDHCQGIAGHFTIDPAFWEIRAARFDVLARLQMYYMQKVFADYLNEPQPDPIYADDPAELHVKNEMDPTGRQPARAAGHAGDSGPGRTHRSPARSTADQPEYDDIGNVKTV